MREFVEGMARVIDGDTEVIRDFMPNQSGELFKKRPCWSSAVWMNGSDHGARKGMCVSQRRQARLLCASQRIAATQC